MEITSAAWQAFFPSIGGGEVYQKRIDHFVQLHGLNRLQRWKTF